MADIPECVRRRMISDDLRALFEATIQERVNRHLEVSPQEIIANHHFAVASAECIRLYTDGYFLSTVMVTQAVTEAIRRFVVERNEIKPGAGIEGPQIAEILVKNGIISKDCADAFNRIWESFRNDVHHMNPKVAAIDFPGLAKRNIQDLAAIEREIFAFKMDNGRIIPTNPKYWDTREDGKMGAFLRLRPCMYHLCGICGWHVFVCLRGGYGDPPRKIYVGPLGGCFIPPLPRWERGQG